MMGYLGTGERRNYAFMLRQRGLAEGLVGIDGSDCGDWLSLLWGLTELVARLKQLFLWIGLRRAEGLTSCRGLAVLTLRARLFSSIKGESQFNQRTDWLVLS